MELMQFNDGVVSVYSVENLAQKGETPKETLAALPKIRLRYHRRTVGVKRHYEALQASDRVDLLLRVPYRPMISTDDIAIPTEDERQYRITLIQRIEGIFPPVMDLTLRRVEHEYDKQDQQA